MIKKILNPKLLIIIILISIAYLAWSQPQQIPYPALRAQVEKYKKPTATSSGISVTLDTPALVKQTQLVVSNLAKTIKIPTNVTGLPEEIVVEDVVNNLTAQVKKLPENQVKVIKTEFCQDVINEATATVAGIGTEK
jgi:hypothetical protein